MVLMAFIAFELKIKRSMSLSAHKFIIKKLECDSKSSLWLRYCIVWIPFIKYF